MAELIMITGGAKSGKSTWALTLSQEQNYHPRYFIATAIPFDDEMKLCIKKHQQERDPGFQTCEEPYELAGTLRRHIASANQLVLIDCLTVWLGNLFYKYAQDEEKIDQAISSFLQSVSDYKQQAQGTIITVTNELGWGIVPAEPGTRLYRNKVGQLNQKLGQLADKLYLCVAGVPLLIKTQAGKSNLKGAAF